MRSFGAVMEGLADGALELAFGAEWIKLESNEQRLVRQDFLEASEDEGVTAREYLRLIGAGNLKSYAAVMIVRERKGWDK